MTRYLSMGPRYYRGTQGVRVGRGKRETFVASSGRTPLARKSRVTRAHSLCAHTGKHHGSQINATRFAGGCLFKKLPVTSRVIHFRRFAAQRTARLFENECCMIPLPARWLRIHYIPLSFFRNWSIKSK